MIHFDVEGIKSPYEEINFVGTLLFAYYPTTMVYSDDTDIPIIKEWVDSSDDNSIDRFFYYKVEKSKLKKFIDGKISHAEFINSSLENWLVFEDVRDDDTIKAFRMPLQDLPVNYKPKDSFYFNHGDGVDVEEIIEYYKLGNLTSEELNKSTPTEQVQELKARIEFIPTGKKVATGEVINVSTHYQIFRTVDTGSEIVSCYIPAFDIYYDAPNMEEGLRRSGLMAQAFLKFWLDKQGFKKFISHIIKLGFRADALTTTNLTHGKPIKKKTDLSFPIFGVLPIELKNAISVEQQVNNFEVVQ